MKDIFKFTLPKLCFWFMLGIICSKYIPLPFFWIISALLVNALLSIFFHFIYRNSFTKPLLHGIAIYCLFTLLGWTCFYIHQDSNYIHHYSHFKNKERPHVLQLTITETLKPTAYYEKYEAQIQSINNNKSFGKILINYQKDSLRNTLLTLGKSIFVYTGIHPIKPPKNPYEFNYGKYLENQQIAGQIYLEDSNFQIQAKEANSIKKVAANLRTTIIQTLKTNGLKGDDLAITEALFLGQRQHISKELYNSYANAGVIHLLAISGLHIGMLTAILSFLLYPLLFLKNGKTWKGILIVTLLWCFAIISGLSASVTRSVVMFSLITIALHLKRPQHTLHTVFTSAFLLLLWKPNFLFEVGFQLSYLAVIGIVILQPRIQTIFHSQNIVLRYLFGILSTTFSAQIAVLPLTFFYFHQFPGLFFIGNFILIPLLFLLLIYGFMMMILSYFNLINETMLSPLIEMISFMNNVIQWIATQKQFLVTNIHFDTPQLILSYIGIVLFAYWISYKKVIVLKLLLLMIIAFQVYTFSVYTQLRKENELVVFHQTRNSLIGIKTDEGLLVFKKDSLMNTAYILNNYKTEKRIDLHEKEFQNVIVSNNQKLLIVDENYSLNIPKKNFEYILLSNSPQVNLERIIANHQPKKIIIDGNNYTTYTNHWKSVCEKQKIPFHITSEKGAFIIKF